MAWGVDLPERLFLVFHPQLEGLDFWLPMGFILAGVLLFLWEISMPGFFVAIPATVSVVLGIIGLFVKGFLTNPGWVLLVGIMVAAPMTMVTIRIYRRLAPPDAAPTTTTGESLVGQEGLVMVEVQQDNTRGKVRIQGQLWSARTESEPAIPSGTRVVVDRTQGVHVVVRPKEAPAPQGASSSSSSSSEV